MLRKLRIVYLLPAEGFGGAERQGVYHLAELPRYGVEVTALAGPGESLARELRSAGVPFEPFEHFPDGAAGAPWSLESTLYKVRWLAALKRSSSHFEQRVRDLEPDLIFANRTFGWLVAAQAARSLGVPYVIRAGSRLAHRALAPALRLLNLVAPPAAVFYNCRAVADAVASRLRCPALSLPNAVDLHRFGPGSAGSARARLGLPTDIPLIGLAARPAPEKGLDLFERVVHGVRVKNPRALFVIAGDFPFRSKFEARFRAIGLGESAVRFLGHVDAMPDFFRAVDVVVLTSQARSIEASPNALLEAMAAGRPVVSTAVGGVPELVTDGREGYLVEPGDAARLTTRILDLLNDGSLRDAFGQAGREKASLSHGVPFVVANLAMNLRAVALTASQTHPTGAFPAHGAS